MVYGEKVYATNKREIKKQELVESVTGGILIHLDTMPKNVSEYAIHPNGEREKVTLEIELSKVYLHINEYTDSLIYTMEVDK